MQMVYEGNLTADEAPAAWEVGANEVLEMSGGKAKLLPMYRYAMGIEDLKPVVPNQPPSPPSPPLEVVGE